VRVFDTVLEAARRQRRPLGALAVGAALALLHGPELFEHVLFSASRWHFADDARVLIHPLFRVEDPSLFPTDPSVEYFLRSLPDGYHLLYRLLGPLAGVTLLSKLLPYLLLVVTLGCLAFMSARLSGIGAVLGTLSLALGSAYLLGRMAGGLPRSFALPLLAFGAALLVAGHVRSLAALVVVSAGFYPVAALILGASLALWLLLPAQDRGSAAAWSLRRRWLVVAGTAALAGLVLLPSALRLREYGDTITPALWRAFPEAGPGGRFDPIDRAPFPGLPEAAGQPFTWSVVGAGQPLVFALNLRDHAGTISIVLSLIALIGSALLARRRPEARRLLLFLAAVVVCHTLALAAGLRLFIPERYVAYAVPVLALVAVPSALGAFAAAKQLYLRVIPVVYNVLLLALVGAHGASTTGLTVIVPPTEIRVHEAIAWLPKTAVVAGWPGEVIDSVPYLTRRAAFITRETQMPFHTRYTRAQRARTRALIAAYFAGSLEPIRALRDDFRVTHLLVDRRHFERRPTYIAPFEPEIARAFDAARNQGGFAALALATRAEVFRSGPLLLLDLQKL
jgi:hypothetical protein